MVINQQKLISFNYHHDLATLNNVNDKNTPLEKHISWSYCWVYIYIYGGGLVTKLCLILATPWTVAHQVPLSMGISRQEYWSRLPFSSPWYLPDPRIEPSSPALQADSLPTELWGKHFQKWSDNIVKLKNKIKKWKKRNYNFLKA